MMSDSSHIKFHSLWKLTKCSFAVLSEQVEKEGKVFDIEGVIVLNTTLHSTLSP